MAVERLTDYTRRIWTGLGTDDPAGHDIHVNDVIYYMDSSECCVVTHVYPDGSIDCETLPDVGGGGGGTAPVDLAITCQNSTGVTMSSIEGTYWSPRFQLWAMDVYTNKATGTLFMDHTDNRVQRLTDGRLAVFFRIATGSNHAPGSITYNGEALETDINGSTRTYNYKVYLPDNYDPDIPIVFH